MQNLWWQVCLIASVLVSPCAVDAEPVPHAAQVRALLASGNALYARAMHVVRNAPGNAAGAKKAITNPKSETSAFFAASERYKGHFEDSLTELQPSHTLVTLNYAQLFIQQAVIVAVAGCDKKLGERNLRAARDILDEVDRELHGIFRPKWQLPDFAELGPRTNCR
jgi:hypothetical protein